jgi:DNA repair exonuclease SbcCD nuclease subunit
MEDVNILVIGDPHFKVSSVPEHNKMCQAIIDVAKVKNIDLIVILGDILDRHESINSSPLTRSIKFFSSLIEIAPIYALIGNHDLKNNKQFLSDEHGFTSFNLSNAIHTKNISDIIYLIKQIILDENVLNNLINDIENIVTSTKITIVDKVTTTTIKNQKFVFVPYVPPGKFQSALDTEKLNMSDISCIFSHQEFKGAQMGPIISVDGDIWSVNNPYIISGHIHDYQHLQENILYTGTPIQHSFGDNPNKTISYFKFHSILDRTEERISLGLPRKSTVKLTCEEVYKYIPPVNSKLRINITGNQEAVKAIMLHPNIAAWKKLGHTVTEKYISLNNTNEELRSVPPKYSVALQNSIQNNPELQKTYHNIFGKPKQIYKPKPLKLNVIK